jgi:hypothetical protein
VRESSRAGADVRPALSARSARRVHNGTDCATVASMPREIATA